MFSIKELVTASKTNQDGYLKTVSIVNMMQDCSQMWMQSEPTLGKFFSENNISQLLVSRQIDIQRRPQYGENLTITTSVFEIRNFFGYRNTIIYDEQNKACITSWSMGAFVNMTTHKMSKIPSNIFDSLKIDKKIPMDYLDRKITVPDSHFAPSQPVAVLMNDIDMNHHMNNAQYIRIAAEFIPTDFYFNRLRIEYKKPAQKGELIHPSIKIEGQTLFILLLDDKDQPYATVEFSKIG